MPQTFDQIRQRVLMAVKGIMEAQGRESVGNIKRSLSKPGSPVPMVYAPVGEPSTNWYNNMIDAITFNVEVRGNMVTLNVVSDAVDQHMGQGHFSYRAEKGGHFWDGRAYDPRSGKIVQVAPPHVVGPRPHMAPELDRLLARLEAELVPQLQRALLGEFQVSVRASAH